jgi:long-chain acyl-CoA synthetase
MNWYIYLWKHLTLLVLLLYNLFTNTSQLFSLIGTIINSFANALKNRNLLGKNDDNLSLLGIYMKNCKEWILCEYSCYQISAATVPLYDTLGPDAVEYVINHTSLQTIICSSIELPSICSIVLLNKCKTLKYIILNSSSGITMKEKLLCKNSNLIVYTFDELCNSNININSVSGSIASPLPHGDTLATFCYTSGTTGNPKGALITHTNIISVAAGALNSVFDLKSNDYYLSFLPLPHIFERMVISALLSCGSAIGFYRGNPLFLIDDCITLKPTIFCSVPRVLNKIYDKIINGMSPPIAEGEGEGEGSGSGSGSGIKNYLFQKGLKTKLKNLEISGQLSHIFYDNIIFNKIKVALGLNNVRKLISGGAPLSSNIMNFWRILLGKNATVHEGYGLTESTGGISLTSSTDLSQAGHVGGPLPCVEICLSDVPDMGYYHSDSLHNGEIRCDGRGEILVRGPGIFNGYYKNKKATSEALTTDGWLRTGDIGLWQMNGQLAIIDRKKNLLKLSQGEYVALEKVEGVFGRASNVNQIFVYGTSTEDHLVAIIVPDMDKKKAALQEKGKGKGSKEEYSNSVMEELYNIGIKNKLKGFEMIKKIYIDYDIIEWGPQNGFTTPTQKLKRQILYEKYKDSIENMYKELKNEKMKRGLSKL